MKTSLPILVYRRESAAGAKPQLKTQRPASSGASWASRTAKRLIDLAAALILLPVMAPFLFSIGILIRSTSKGPAVFRQTRVGKDGQTFSMLKFRTMVADAPDLRNPDNSTFNSDGDPRLTKIGRFLRKTSLDELPQLVNVLRGEMSLVGPRPELPEGPATYRPHQYARLNVRPGITGWAAVHGRNNIPMDTRRNLDAWYARNWTLFLDVKILWRTIAIVLTHRGVHSNHGRGPQGLAAR